MSGIPDRRWMALYAIIVLVLLELLARAGREDLRELLEERWHKLSGSYEQELRDAHDSGEGNRHHQ